jgi:hypothetical protein
MASVIPVIKALSHVFWDQRITPDQFRQFHRNDHSSFFNSPAEPVSKDLCIPFILEYNWNSNSIAQFG